MSEDANVTAEAQFTVAYADVYAILIHNPTNDDCGTIVFASETGTTAWPCMARLFDDAVSAEAAKVELGLPNAQVVRLRLQFTAEAVEMAQPDEMMMPMRRVA